MTKFTKLALVSALSVLLLGCGGNSPSSHDTKTENYTYLNATLTQKKVHDGIINAGEKAGWKMTRFKPNMIIAEKIDDGDTKAVTIIFNSESFSLSPHDSDLKDAILEKLNN